jgi:hypothetical protein
MAYYHKEGIDMWIYESLMLQIAFFWFYCLDALCCLGIISISYFFDHSTYVVL